MARVADLRNPGAGAALRLLMAVPIILAAWTLRAVLVGGLGRGIPYLTFYPAVVICALLGGWAAGCLATLLSALLAFSWIQQGRMTLLESTALALFVASSLGMVLLVAALRRAQNALQAANATLRLDITGLKQVEEERFRAIFEQSPLAIAWHDPQGFIMEANPAFQAMLGYSPAECRELHISRLSHPDEVAENLALREAMLSGNLDRVQQERRLVRKDGETIWVVLRVLPVHDAAGRISFTFTQAEDITGRKQAAEALALERQFLEVRVQSALADLRQKDRMLASQSRLAAMGEMVSNIAHQWRQPLNAIGLLLANLRDAHDAGELDGPAMERSHSAGQLLIQRMSMTINDFRSYLRPDKAMQAFSALEQVRAAVRLMEGSLVANDIRVQITSAEDVQLFGFPNEYSQVLMNLLANAKEAIRERQVHPGLISIRLWTEPGLGGLAMADNGPGIDPERLDRIFEPYYSTREMGTGIGLYMSKQIIEKNMGGRIWAGNGAVGAEFTVLVPASVPAPLDIPGPVAVTQD